MGVITPLTMNIAVIMISAGVKIFPTRSTTLVGVKTKNKVIPKKIREKKTEFIPSFIGATAISNVVAANRGSAKRGPIISITNIIKKVPKIPFMFLIKSERRPPHFPMETIPKMGIPTPVSKKPEKAKTQLRPER